MRTLQLRQRAVGEGRYEVEATLEAPGRAAERVRSTFEFAHTAQEREDLRWYLEDYLQHPGEIERQIASRVEGRLEVLGKVLFERVFPANDAAAQRLWARAEEDLAATRLEVLTDVAGATAIPWELVREPRTGAALALRAQSFVRIAEHTALPARLPTGGGTVRILLVICRPGRADDVPFRSVASRLLKGLAKTDREHFTLDVLRPATYARLAEVLRAARDRSEPYHVVHFDGHGAYLEVQPGDAGQLGELLSRLTPTLLSTTDALLLSGARSGRHGYLLFENPRLEENLQLVDGAALGRLLVEAQVPVLMLNACRSAHAEPPAEPENVEGAGESAGAELREQAIGSLAQEVVEQGVVGVLAMRYNVYVVTAAQLVADVYAALASGKALGEAVAEGRKHLHEQPLRTIAYEPVRLADWSVPVVYELEPVALFSERTGGKVLKIELGGAGATALEARAMGLPPEPDAGFFGRDETLLALDRAFDDHGAVLLHGYAGSGKTTAASEFVRWYQGTGGVEGPILFTSFAQHKTLGQALAVVGAVFGEALEEIGVNWPALKEEERRDVALQVFAQMPVLWVWDNIEPVTGFPRGSATPWSAKEQVELRDFLQEASGTQAKILLTSRREESAWLGELVKRIAIPPMPMQERVELARALMTKRAKTFTDVKAWRPLLEFSGGNPLTLTVVVNHAAKRGLAETEEIAAYVARLRAGEAEFTDEKEEGRSRSLGASLRYGFEEGFTEEERRQLAVLALFQGFVDVSVLNSMGASESKWCLSELEGLTREGWIELLDRAAEVGLLRSHGAGYYDVHPALPWFFQDLLRRQYSGAPEGRTLRDVERAFAESMGELGHFYHNKYVAGVREVVGVVGAEEANLLRGWRLARAYGWWNGVTGAMQGMRLLYDHTGRRGEWARLVEAVVPEFVDPATDGSLPGLEAQWVLVNEYMVGLAREDRDWERAERLQRQAVEWARALAAGPLERDPSSLDDKERNAVRNVGATVHQLGQIQRARGEVACVESYRESLAIDERIGDRAGAAVSAINLGNAYKDLPGIRDIKQAEQWYRRSLGFFPEGDRLGRGKCLNQLGAVTLERLREASRARHPAEELRALVNQAASYYHEGLELIPESAINDMAVTHHQLGIVYALAGMRDESLRHSRKSIAYEEAAGNHFDAARTQFNVAIDLGNWNRFADALDYARGALRNFQRYGPRAATEVAQTQSLIAEIERRPLEKS